MAASPLLAQKLARFQELEARLADSATYGDNNTVKALGAELAQLRPLAACAASLEQARNELASAESMRTDSDAEIQAMAAADIAILEPKVAALEAALDDLLRPQHPFAQKDAILELRAGVGGDEAGLFAGDLLRAYLRFAEREGFKAEVVEEYQGTLAGQIREVIVHVRGVGAYNRFRSESGVHRVQRVPSTEQQGRIHTSTATVAVLPDAESVDLVIRDEDLRFDVYRASGAGGQHVNKTSSAVRITHLPTGMQVACQSQRSQGQNREEAMRLLRSRLLANIEEERQTKEASTRKSQIGSGLRSEKIRTYNLPQDRVTDHRIQENWSNIPGIFDGNFGPLVDAYLKWEKAQMG